MDVSRAVRGLRELADGLLDLALPATCAGCAAMLLRAGPGASGDGRSGELCGVCAGELAGAAQVRWPRPSPEGLPVPWAVADYAGPVRAALLAHKERGRLGLARPLGAGLARSLLAAAPPGAGAFLVVPAPSRGAAVRARGHDATLRLARRAAAVLRAGGRPVHVVPVLQMTRAVADQSGLDAAARAANLRGGLRVVPRRSPLVAGRAVVIVDDVITTGATLAEAARCLRAAGARVSSAAVVAATVRRHESAPPVGSATVPRTVRPAERQGGLTREGRWD